LNNYLSTVFTREDVGIPVLSPLCEAKPQDDEVNVDIIRNKLCSLNEDEAAVDDNLSASPRILKAIASEITLPVTMIFHKSLQDTGCVPRLQRLENSKHLALFLKKQ